MALKKSGDKVKKVSKEKKKGAAAKPTKEKKSRGESRKAFILELVKSAGSKGIATKDIVAATDKKFDYPEGKSSRARVRNSIIQAAEEGILKDTDGTVTWKKG